MNAAHRHSAKRKGKKTKKQSRLRILARERGYQVNVCVCVLEGGGGGVKVGGGAVARGVRKVEGGFDVWRGSAAGEHIVMYLLKFRPLCLIQYICTPFPSFPPAVHPHVYRNNKTRDHKFPHSLSLPLHPSPLVSMFFPFYLFFSILFHQPSTPKQHHFSPSLFSLPHSSSPFSV